ncbi:hypothetical protein BD626DRAFT_569313 [Schizophyllum amplum]|uniref:Uncharacterized protein n=1 Tax=Schizophyllum amplum TaxID=97359 RepID=A0A550CET6_9AGAR|nr:hypothetical protein BD626DRAFT_569313 [Auriculariopsis ampla]
MSDRYRFCKRYPDAVAIFLTGEDSTGSADPEIGPTANPPEPSLDGSRRKSTRRKRAAKPKVAADLDPDVEKTSHEIGVSPQDGLDDARIVGEADSSETGTVTGPFGLDVEERVAAVLAMANAETDDCELLEGVPQSWKEVADGLGQTAAAHHSLAVGAGFALAEYHKIMTGALMAARLKAAEKE